MEFLSKISSLLGLEKKVTQEVRGYMLVCQNSVHEVTTGDKVWKYPFNVLVEFDSSGDSKWVEYGGYNNALRSHADTGCPREPLMMTDVLPEHVQEELI